MDMTTNSICTVVRTADDGTYFIAGTYFCMWQETEAYEVKKYGEERADRATVYIPDINADIIKGDYITSDAVPDNIDVSGMLAVSSVTRHNYGSEAMQHLRVGAR